MITTKMTKTTRTDDEDAILTFTNKFILAQKPHQIPSAITINPSFLFDIALSNGSIKEPVVIITNYYYFEKC